MTERRLIALALLLALATSFKLDCPDVAKAQPNRGFHYQVNTIGGSGKYRYEASGLPAGLKMQGPVIAGIPRSPGRFSVLLYAYDDQGASTSKTINIEVGDLEGSSDSYSSSSSQQLSSSASQSTSSLSRQSISSSSTMTRNAAVVEIGSGRLPSTSEVTSNQNSVQFGAASSINLGPYDCDSSGYPIFRTDSKGKYIFLTNTQGDFILPRDAQGFNIYPFDDQGNPVLPRRSDGRIIFQLDSKGLPTLPKNKYGRLVFPVDDNGSTVVPADSNGRKIYPLNGDGDAILPSMTPISIETAFPLLVGSVSSRATNVHTSKQTSRSLTGVTSVSSISQSTGESSIKSATSTTSKPIYPTGPKASFPTPSFPTGTSKDFIPSNLPTQISNYQYKVDPVRDTYQATSLDIESQAVFLRQINANKVVANLLSIIQSLTANLNGVQGDIPGATQALNQALADQRTAQALVQSAESANKTLTSNLQTVRSNINQLQQALAKTKTEMDSTDQQIITISSQTDTIHNQISESQSKLEQFSRAQSEANQLLRQSNQDLSDAKQSILNYTSSIDSIKQELNNAPTLKQSVDANIVKFKEKILQLEQELAKARSDLAAAQNKSDYLANLPTKASSVIRQYQNLIDSQQSRISQILQPAIEKAESTVQSISESIVKYQTRLDQAKITLKTSSTSITTYTKSKSTLSEKYNSLVESIASSTNELNHLLRKVPAYGRTVADSYSAGNDANDKVQHLKDILNALKEKYMVSLRELNEAKAKLEQARSEKELADIVVNEQIKKQGGSTILPFSLPQITNTAFNKNSAAASVTKIQSCDSSTQTTGSGRESSWTSSRDTTGSGTEYSDQSSFSGRSGFGLTGSSSQSSAAASSKYSSSARSESYVSGSSGFSSTDYSQRNLDSRGC